MLHFVNQFQFGKAAFPVLFRINIYVKLDIIKSGGIGSVIGASGLRHHLFHFRKASQLRPHLVCQIDGLIQSYTLR